MTTLTQIWMTLVLSNILPIDHNSDLPLLKCQLVYAILTQRMEPYMQHVADQQAANHRGQVQLNESFYQYTLHQHNQDPSPYSWLTPEQFGATIAWPGDRSNFQAGEGPARTPRDEDGAQENDDTTNVMNFFL
ncbi:hypothetical protein HKD37_04G010378 [Glycine soja]